MVVFHLPCYQSASPGLQGDVIPPSTNGQSDLEGDLSYLLAYWDEGFGCTMEPGEVQEPARGAPPVGQVRTQAQILGLPISGRRGA
jgi:hypothetical protein